MTADSLSFGADLRRRMAANLARFERRDMPRGGLRRAAVAIAVMHEPSRHNACFLLTRRPAGLPRHGGQYALPGGRLEPGESAVQAALRELHEELGVASSPAAVLGLLDDYRTRSGFVVSPVVLWLDGAVRVRPDPGEVAAVFRVPLDDLLHDDVPRLHAIEESEREVLSIHFRSLAHEVYAPTAAMLYQFREVALCARATRVADYEQPVFAWR